MDEETRALAAALLARLSGEAPRAGKRHTVGELHAKWAEAHCRLESFKCDDARVRRLIGLEPFALHGDDGDRTLVTWAPVEGPHAGVRLADRPADTLTGDDIDAFRSWRYLTTTRRRGAPGTSTINREIMSLKRVLNHAVKRNTIQRSPLHGFEVEDEDNAREVVIEEDQLAALLEAFGDDLRMRALTLLGYDSGMRRAELLCCRWSWLDPHAGQIHVPGAIAKNGEKRITDLSVRAWDACQEMPRHVKTDLLFPNPDSGDPYNGRWIHELFVRGVERAGIVGRDGTPPRLHDLRRSFVTLMGRRGVPESVIMAKSGHKDHKVFKRYRIVNELELREAWVRMEAGRQAELAAIRVRRGPKRIEPDADAAPANRARS